MSVKPVAWMYLDKTTPRLNMEAPIVLNRRREDYANHPEMTEVPLYSAPAPELAEALQRMVDAESESELWELIETARKLLARITPKMSGGLFPDSLADAYKASAGEKYRPSNGTEGELFRGWFCDRCTKDVNSDCIIYAKTLTFDTDDAEYPKEWVISEDGQPKCTAYEPMEASK